jgi:hypothetical protein
MSWRRFRARTLIGPDLAMARAHDNAPITHTHTPTRTAAPSDWDGRQNQCPRLFFGENRAGTDPRRVPDAHPVNTHSVRARLRPR